MEITYPDLRVMTSESDRNDAVSSDGSSSSLRISTWNCARGSFESRAQHLNIYAPTLSLFQEIGRPKTDASNRCWFGTYPPQSGVVTIDPSLTAQLEPAVQEIDLPSCVPVRIAGPKPFRALMLWAQKDPTYVQAIWNNHDRYADWIQEEDCVIAGDFNSTPTVEKTKKRPRHLDLVDRLRDKFGLVSAYHEFHGVPHGEELDATYYHLKHRDSPFHLDYCFVPESWRVENVRVGTFAEWIPHSDHCPVIVDVSRS